MAKQEYVNFVWPEDLPFIPWAGGSETYTLRQMSELQKQGVDARLVLAADAPPSDIGALGVPVEVVKDKDELTAVDGTLVFALAVSFDCDASDLERPAYVILHTPKFGKNENLRGHNPLVPSRFMAEYWKKELNLAHLPPVIYPPIDEAFSQAVRCGSTCKALFAGRPVAEKGVYTLLASLDCPPLRNRKDFLSCVKTINNNDPRTKDIHAIFDNHPRINALPPQPNPQAMAGLLAAHDVVVVPSIWEEPFCMLSVEAQQAGCRVVASNIGGLPETDSGGLMLVEPNNPGALAEGIAAALDAGPLTSEERAQAAVRFAPEDSVNALRRAIHV